MGVVAAGLAVAVVGAGVGVYAANQAGKGSGQSRSTDELNNLPYDQQLDHARAYADAQFGLYQRQLGLDLQYAPAFAAQQRAQAEAMGKSLLKLYPGFAAAESKATSKSRTSDLADFTKNAGGWYDSLESTSPAYAAIGQAVQHGGGSPLLDYLNMQAFQAGPSDLRTALQQRALSDLQYGGQLSPEEERLAQQSARGAWSDRGLLYSNPAVTGEILNRDLYAQQRLAQRQAAAGNAWQVGQNEDTANRNFGLGVQGVNEAAQGNWRNFLVAASQAQLNPILSAGMQRTPVNPMALLGLYQSSQAPQTVAQVATTAPSIYQGVQALTPLYNYGNDVYGTNFAAAESRANAQANAYSAVGSGLMNVGGSMAGGGMGGGGARAGGGGIYG